MRLSASELDGVRMCNGLLARFALFAGKPGDTFASVNSKLHVRGAEHARTQLHPRKKPGEPLFEQGRKGSLERKI